jgi:hypothetical protein
MLLTHSLVHQNLPSETQVMKTWQGNYDRPLVTVLCHTYNQVDYIDDALRGIVSQISSFPFEVIVRDDASSDGTTDIVRCYESRYPNLIRTVIERNNRYCEGEKPIAVTFPLARGEFLAFCEGDDYWPWPNKLEPQVRLLQAHAEIGAVHGNYMNLKQINGTWRRRVALRHAGQLRNRSGSLYPAMLQSNRVQTCTLMCRRQLVAEYRATAPGVDSYAVGDWPLTIYLAHESDVGFIESPIAVYRQTPGSLVNSGNAAAVSRCFDAIKMVHDFCDHFNDDAELRTSALISQYDMLLWLAYRAGDSSAFAAAWRWLNTECPTKLRNARAFSMRATIASDVLRKTSLSILSGIESVKHSYEFTNASKWEV